MQGISKDLRERIVKRYEKSSSAKEVASYYEVSERSVYRYAQGSREGQSLSLKPVGGSRSILEREGLHESISKLVKEDAEASLQSYVDQLKKQTGFVMSRPSMCRALQQLGLSRKKRQNNLRNAIKFKD